FAFWVVRNRNDEPIVVALPARTTCTPTSVTFAFSHVAHVRIYDTPGLAKPEHASRNHPHGETCVHPSWQLAAIGRFFSRDKPGQSKNSETGCAHNSSSGFPFVRLDECGVDRLREAQRLRGVAAGAGAR